MSYKDDMCYGYEGNDPHELTEEVDDGMFHIPPIEDEVCETLICTKCRGKEFNVGQGSYYTAIRCVNCKWELCIHEG